MIKDTIFDYFPAPYFRKYQKETILKMAELFDSGVRCILLEAPVGSGKSIINTVFARCFESFYTTPQLSLIEQILRDENIGKYYLEIKGRRNYRCYYNNNLTVESGMCVRSKRFECNKYEVCEYYKRKKECLNWKSVLTSTSYLILESLSEGSETYLGERDLLIIDEGHNIPEIVLDHITLSVSPFALGKFFNMVKKNIADTYYDISDVTELVEYVLNEAKRFKSTVERTLDGGIVIPEEVAELSVKLDRWIKNAEIFLNSVDKNWVWEVKKLKEDKYVVIKPVYSRDFMFDYLLKRGNRIIVSSATILNPKMFIFESGLDKVYKSDEIAVIKVPCIFDKNNRPIIDATVGKLTIDEKNKNIGYAIRIIENILRLEKGKVAIHCHSYEFANMIYDYISPDLRNRLIIHNQENRNEKLKEWYASKDGVFVCVRFEEGQDWKGELCDAQILLKVPYPDSKEDARVYKRLMENKDWTWYNIQTLKEVIQAYGRAIRCEEDKKRFYVIDSSFPDLISRCWNYVPDWFKEALPEHWNKDKIEDAIRKLKIARMENLAPELRGKSETELKRYAIEALKYGEKQRGKVIWKT